MTIQTLLRTVVMTAVVAVAGAATGTFVRGAFDIAGGDEVNSSALSVGPEDHSDEAYERATVRFSGELAGETLLALPDVAADSTLLIVVRGTDTETCEDLGRQLRDLHRSVADSPEWNLAILVDAGGELTLRRFLARERIPEMPIVPGEPGAFLADGRNVGTPAVLVADRKGRIRAGVSHPSRFRNARRRSFAEELQLIRSGHDREPG